MKVMRLAHLPPPAVTVQSFVREAISTISSLHGCAVGVVANGRLVGTLSKEEILKRVVATGRDPASTMVGEIMTAHPLAVPPDFDSHAALTLMLDRHQCFLPIVGSAGELRGWLSICHLFQEDVQDRERELQSMAAYTGADRFGA